jgi:hypothetical protein
LANITGERIDVAWGGPVRKDGGAPQSAVSLEAYEAASIVAG